MDGLDRGINGPEEAKKVQSRVQRWCSLKSKFVMASTVEPPREAAGYAKIRSRPPDEPPRGDS